MIIDKPSGKLTELRKITILIGRSTSSMGHLYHSCHSYVKKYRSAVPEINGETFSEENEDIFGIPGYIRDTMVDAKLRILFWGCKVRTGIWLMILPINGRICHQQCNNQCNKRIIPNWRRKLPNLTWYQPSKTDRQYQEKDGISEHQKQSTNHVRHVKIDI